MFVTYTTLNAIIKAKDETICSLRDELRWLRRMVQPERGSRAPLIEEADLVIGGHQEQIVEPLNADKQADIEAEAARLLSGRY